MWKLIELEKTFANLLIVPLIKSPLSVYDVHAWWRISSSAKGWRDVYISTSRSLRYCRPAGIQSDWSEFPVSRGLFPTAGQDVRGCKAVNLSALIETTGGDEGIGWGRFVSSTVRRRENFFSLFPFLLAFISSFFFFIHSLSSVVSQRTYSLKCHEQRSISYRCEKDDNTRLYQRRIKMTGRKIEREKCCEKEKFLQFIVSLHQFSTLRDFKYIGRYLLAFNALTSLLASL